MEFEKEEIFINLTGEIIKDRYCILEKIGGGGNGSVYLALDMELGCKWAVKVIEHNQKKEAHVLKELNHPFLPKMIDYEETESYCYLVMEYIEGENLENYLYEKKRICIEECMKIICSIANILAYFHTLKPSIIYGDMKPSNLIRTKSGEIYLVDFGSVIYGFRDNPPICQGTRGYAAPEQYQGRITVASDVYAFGYTMKFILNHTKWNMGKSSLFWIQYRCCRKREKYRYKNMEEVFKRLQKMKPGEKISRSVFQGSVLFLAILFGLTVGIKEMSKITEQMALDFGEELTKVTDLYWEDKKNHRTGEFSDFCCKEADRILKEMFQKFGEEEEQREILRMLAVNAEYMEEYRNAAFYYEQMLVYDSEYIEGYGMYGSFLMRMGLEEESVRLYEKYLDMNIGNKNGISENEPYYCSKWKECVEATLNE